MDYDVIVIGEVLLEVSTQTDLRHGGSAQLAFSGDALNAAAAAAAAGARVGLLTRIGDDEVGTGVLGRVAELGVDTDLIIPTADHNGGYVMSSDPNGAREFSYLRRGSAASKLSAEDVRQAHIERAQYVLTSGITAALSETTRAAVRYAHDHANAFVYDPNYRSSLVDVATAADTLHAVSAGAALVTPSHPTETKTLLNCDSPETAARRLRRSGANAVAVTCGPDGVLLDDEHQSQRELSAAAAPRLVDQTGAGDIFVGTATARLALGDDLIAAVELALAAASLSVGGRGGTGNIPALADSRTHQAAAVEDERARCAG